MPRMMPDDGLADNSDTTSVYRYYDSHDVLLYVGITSRGPQRQQEHNATKEWWPYVARQDVRHWPTRAAAEADEYGLIRKHRPPYNRQHNPGWEEVQQAYLGVLGDRSIPDVDPASVVHEMHGLLSLVHGLERQQSSGFWVYGYRTRLQDAAVVARILTPEAQIQRGYGYRQWAALTRFEHVNPLFATVQIRASSRLDIRPAGVNIRAIKTPRGPGKLPTYRLTGIAMRRARAEEAA